MTERVGFYPGSFDPVTNGHIDVIQRAAQLVDRLVIGVGVNATKSPFLTEARRHELLEATVAPIAEASGSVIEIRSFQGLMVKAAKEFGATIVIRGLRDTTDYNYEMQMVGMNADMAPDVHTVFVPSSPAVRHISATLVRQIISMGGDASAFVPAQVLEAIEAS